MDHSAVKDGGYWDSDSRKLKNYMKYRDADF
jgi:hypothetical protein